MKHLFSFRNILTLMLIMVGVFLCVVATAYALFGSCVNRYHSVMPVYDGAELVESEGSALNYLGLGPLRTVWFVADDPAAVEQWYHEQINQMRRAEREAQRNDTSPPPIWEADWRVVPVEGGAQVRMQAACY